jgi:hypothetical protein
MGKRNNADGVVGLPDRNTGSGADHLPDGGVSIRWFIEYRLWAENSSSDFDGVGSAYRTLSRRRDRKGGNGANRTEHPPSATLSHSLGSDPDGYSTAKSEFHKLDIWQCSNLRQPRDGSLRAVGHSLVIATIDAAASCAGRIVTASRDHQADRKSTRRF